MKMRNPILALAGLQFVPLCAASLHAQMVSPSIDGLTSRFLTFLSLLTRLE